MTNKYKITLSNDRIYELEDFDINDLSNLIEWEWKEIYLKSLKIIN